MLPAWCVASVFFNFGNFLMARRLVSVLPRVGAGTQFGLPPSRYECMLACACCSMCLYLKTLLHCVSVISQDAGCLSSKIQVCAHDRYLRTLRSPPLGYCVA